MLSSIPNNLKQEITTNLQTYFEKDNLNILDFKFNSGGCINNTGILETDHEDVFIKWNSKSRFPEMFKIEAKGLQLLAKAGSGIKIPEVLGYGDDGNHIYIILECVKSSAKSSFYWEDLGRNLAKLHSYTELEFGLDYDNYIGSLDQKNSRKIEWIDFFIQNRLLFIFQMAFDKGLMSKSEEHKIRNLIKILPEICPDNVQASLMHGDLWSGNIMMGKNGEPVLIDPAVYFGFREMELAFTQLFGRFGEKFYSSYQEKWPLDQGFRERIDIWNLYPLLVHVNLFGSSYSSSVIQILNKFK